MLSSRAPLIALALAAAVSPALLAQAPPGGDPPARVGRVSFLSGPVSLYPGGATDWTPAALNYPLTTDDALWSDADARAEVHLGSSAIRISSQASLVFGEISDTVTQVRLDQGSIDVHVRYLNDNEVYEIDSPSGIVSLYAEGHYRIDVTPDGRRTTLTVRDGSAQVTVSDRDYPVQAGQSATILGANRAPVIGAPVPSDDWETWADDRDHREDAAQSTRFVSRDMVGYEDLDDFGGWQIDASLGPVWIPRSVPAGWAPYRFGHWESVRPWGWTWIDDAPWGFAPFHYGRWTFIEGRWGWIPGEPRVRPVYAPALVAFVGGGNWGAAFAVGGGAVGWVPLGPGEAYIPAYPASPTYLRRVNVTVVNVKVVDVTRIDVAQVRYVNRDVPGAVTAVPRDAFEHARPIATAAVFVRPADIATGRPSPAPIAGGQPIAPLPRDAVADRGRGPGGRDTPVPHPPRSIAAGQATSPAPPPQWRTPRGRGNDQQTAGQPSVRPAPSSATPPGTPPPPPDRSRVRPTPPPPPPVTNQPPTSGTTPQPEIRPRPAPGGDAEQAWQQQRKQLVDRQTQEGADLDRRQQAQLRQLPPGTSPVQLRKQQQDEKRALAEKQQRERDALDKQHRAPGGA